MEATTIEAQLSEAVQRGYVAAYRFLGTADEARDACQEAAARALKARDRYDASQPFYPWFYRILKNHCLDRLKDRKRMVPTSQPELSLPPSGGGPAAERQLIAYERERALASSVAELPDELREMIELRHFQDASYEEMAAIVGCPAGTVMSRLYRARKALRKSLIAEGTLAGRPAPSKGVTS